MEKNIDLEEPSPTAAEGAGQSRESPVKVPTVSTPRGEIFRIELSDKGRKRKDRDLALDFLDYCRVLFKAAYVDDYSIEFPTPWCVYSNVKVKCFLIRAIHKGSYGLLDARDRSLEATRGSLTREQLEGAPAKHLLP